MFNFFLFKKKFIPLFFKLSKMKKIFIFFVLFTISLNSYSKSNYHFYLKKDYSTTSDLFSVLSDKGFESTNNLFKWCCDCISYYAKLTGLTYEEMNILLFVIIQPLLIMIFLSLYLLEKRKLNHLIRRLS